MKKINNRGVTLIEVTISLAVLAFGILSLMLLYTSGIRGTVKAQSLTRKTTLGAARIEEIMTTSYSKVENGCEEKTIQGIPTKTCLTITPNTPIKNTKKVEVRIIVNDNENDAISYEYIKPYHR